MSLLHWLLSFSVAAFVCWVGRGIALAGARKFFVISCRISAVLALCASLWGPAWRRTHDVPRRVIYLVDHSASIDEAQAAWAARRIASLESLRPAQVERALVAFGAEPHLVRPFETEPLTDPDAIARAIAGTPVSPGQTNLEAALLGALALIPHGYGGHVILLSDGRETAGTVGTILSSVHRLGLEVSVVPLPTFGEATTVWDKLIAPPSVRRGSPVPLQCVVFNGSPRPKSGALSVALHGVVLKRQRVAIRPGWQVVTVNVPTIQRGTLELDVSLEVPADGLREQRRAYTEVEGPPQVLFVSERAGSLPMLAGALKRREIDLAIARPQDLSSDVTPALKGGVNHLLDHDAILLFNLPKSSLSDQQVETLRTYVADFGGGVVWVGLGGDLAAESATPAPLDALLPVAFQPKGLQEAKRRVCMVMLIDRSASMMGPRIAATKRAAVALVKQLAPEDLVGIFAFDTRPYVVAEVQPAGQIGTGLVEKLATLRSTGGTDVLPALATAANRLNQTDATVKHIILLSDGNTPYEKKTYDVLLDALRRDATTISTIGIGAAFINSAYLEYVAKATGGSFYQMRSLDELPQIIARDTERALGHLPFAEGYFRPTKSPTTDWFADTAEWPTLRGFLTGTAKPGAQVDLTVNGGEGDEPLLARWSVGQGRVVSWMSDADTRWSPAWIRWPGFEATWAQIVRWAMRSRLTEELFVWIDESRGSPQLVLEGRLQEPRAELVPTEGGGRIPLALVQTGPWRWQTPLEQIPGGWYQVSLESHPAPNPSAGGAAAADQRATLFAKRWVQIGNPPASREITGQPSDETRLREIARVTGGAYDEPDRAFLPPTTTATTTEPLLSWWLPFALVALLVDTALRGGSML